MLVAWNEMRLRVLYHGNCFDGCSSAAVFSRFYRERIAKGPDEQDLVNSGLEETMIAAFHELLKTKRTTNGIPDLRIAAFVSAIHKVARSYMEMGIFP